MPAFTQHDLTVPFQRRVTKIEVKLFEEIESRICSDDIRVRSGLHFECPHCRKPVVFCEDSTLKRWAIIHHDPWAGAIRIAAATGQENTRISQLYNEALKLLGAMRLELEFERLISNWAQTVEKER